jgi:hypothetical protein
VLELLDFSRKHWSEHWKHHPYLGVLGEIPVTAAYQAAAPARFSQSPTSRTGADGTTDEHEHGHGHEHEQEHEHDGTGGVGGDRLAHGHRAWSSLLGVEDLKSMMASDDMGVIELKYQPHGILVAFAMAKAW